MNGLPEVKVKAHVLVRDANGRPKIDGNPQELPDEIKGALTQEEYAKAVERFKETLNGNS